MKLLFFFFSASNLEENKGIFNRKFQKSASTETKYKGKGNDKSDIVTPINRLKSFAMSNTAVNSYSSMDSQLFGIPQHRKVRRGLSDIDPKYVSQVSYTLHSLNISIRDSYLFFK